MVCEISRRGKIQAMNMTFLSFGRLVWILALVASITAACYQIIDRAIFFASNPKSVDVEIKFADQLTFPAVTICNCNNYRYDLCAKVK